MNTFSEGNYPLQEQELVEKARRGDAQAFDLLIRKHSQRILAFLISLCLDAVGGSSNREIGERKWRKRSQRSGQGARTSVP